MSKLYRIIICIEFIVFFGFLYIAGIISVLSLFILPFTGLDYAMQYVFSLISSIGFFGMNFSMLSIIYNDRLKYKHKILLILSLLLGVVAVSIVVISMFGLPFFGTTSDTIGFFVWMIPVAFTFQVIWIIYFKLETITKIKKK